MNKKDLLIKIHGYIASDGATSTWKSKDMHGKKLRVRKRLRNSFFNSNDVLIADFINTMQLLYPNIRIRHVEKRLRVDVRNHRITKDILELGNVGTYDWEVPKKSTNKQKRIWIRAFADCDGTVYNKNYNRYVAIDSMNLKGLEEISKILKKFNIENSIYSVKYKSITSYRLRIYRKENLVRFNNLIGFNHPLKKEKLNNAIASYRNI